MTLTHEIRQRLAATHERIERLPLAEEMKRGTLHRAAYIKLLGQLGLIHASLEEGLANNDLYSALGQPEERRAETIRRDLAYLGAKETPRPLAATGHLVKKLDTWAHTSPPALIGVYYVLEGSRMGSMVLAKPLSQSLAVPLKPGCGLDYHIEGLQQRPQQWQAFKERLDSLPLALANKDAILAAAAATMEGLFDLYAALSDLAIASEREIPDGKQNWALLGAS